MSGADPDALLGRIAVHHKVITLEQLRQAMEWQSRKGGNKRLGQVLLELRLCTQEQLQKLNQLQEQHIARRRAEASASQPQSPTPQGSQIAVFSSNPQVRADARGTPAPTRIEKNEARRTPAEGRGAPISESQGASEPRVTLPDPRAGRVDPRGEQPTQRPRPPQSPAGVAASQAETGLQINPRQVRSANESESRLHAILRHAVEMGASDVHMHAGAPVKLRVRGSLMDLDGNEIPKEALEALFRESIPEAVLAKLDEAGEADFAYTIPSGGRFRSNIYRQQHGLDCAFRLVPSIPPTLEQLRLPNVLAKLMSYHQGLVLITGPGGSGKSSTLAALINIVNEERNEHIITIEDPIETLHPSKRSIVNQRQVGPHTGSFARALRASIREDPDVIAIGELRDLETISLALSAAETGHLVVATLHTGGAIRTIDRLVGVFPPSQQSQMRTMLSDSLRGIVSQRLVPTADGKGRIPALEILLASRAVSNLIRENKSFQIRDVLVTGASHGMCLLDTSLLELVKSGMVRREDAARFADEPKKFGM